MKTVEITTHNYVLFQHLLAPAFLKPLQLADPTLWGVGLLKDSVPIGVLLAKVDVEAKTAKIVHLVVRTQQAYVDAIEDLMDVAEYSLGKRRLEITDVLVTLDRDVEAVRDVFFNRGWKARPQIVKKYVMDIQKIERAEWMWELERPSHLEILPWSVAVERNDVENSFVKKRVQNVTAVDADSSFALYASGVLVGWCLCEKVARNMLLSSSMYVERSVATRLGGLLLFAEFAKKVWDDKLYVTFFVHADNKNLLNSVSRRFRECIIHEATHIQWTT